MQLIDVKVIPPTGPADRAAVVVRIPCNCGECSGFAEFSGPIPIPPHGFGPTMAHLVPIVQVAVDRLLSEYTKRAASVAAQN